LEPMSTEANLNVWESVKLIEGYGTV